jgi:hypothetical protein
VAHGSWVPGKDILILEKLYYRMWGLNDYPDGPGLKGLKKYCDYDR